MIKARKKLAARFARDVKAAAALEFAIVAMPFCLLCFGSFEFARVVWISNTLQQTANAVARCVGETLTACSDSTAANPTYSFSATKSFATTTAATAGLTIAASNVTVSPNQNCPGWTNNASFAVVTLTYQFTSVVTSLIPPLANKTLSETACFPMSNL